MHQLRPFLLDQFSDVVGDFGDVFAAKKPCGIDPCSAVIGRCSQCALVSVDRATVSRARQKWRPHPMMDRPRRMRVLSDAEQPATTA